MEKQKLNSIIAPVVGVIVALFTYYAIQKAFFTPPLFDKVLLEVANEVNKTCPMRVDQETQLDNVVALPENTFQYNYTLLNLNRVDMDIDDLKKTLEPNIVNSVKTNPSMKVFRDNKTTMVFYYSDKNKEFVFEIVVPPNSIF
jgi:hypothetical protein